MSPFAARARPEPSSCRPGSRSPTRCWTSFFQHPVPLVRC